LNARHPTTSGCGSLTLEQPPLPDFSSFHFAFRGAQREGRFPDARRRPFERVLPFLRRREREYVRHAEAAQAIEAGRDVYRALRHPVPARLPDSRFPAGDQREICASWPHVDVREIHGFRPELGFASYRGHRWHVSQRPRRRVQRWPSRVAQPHRRNLSERPNQPAPIPPLPN